MIVTGRTALQYFKISNQFVDDEFFLKLPLNWNSLAFTLRPLFVFGSFLPTSDITESWIVDRLDWPALAGHEPSIILLPMTFFTSPFLSSQKNQYAGFSTDVVSPKGIMTFLLCS